MISGRHSGSKQGALISAADGRRHAACCTNRASNPKTASRGFVLLYAQWPAAISRLTLDHVQANEQQIRLRLGREPVVLPEPLAALIRELVASRRGHATLGDPGNSKWLFPGGRPGHPISAAHLTHRLRQLGLRPGQDRSSALFHLATELPAALLARLLGINISVAVAWQRDSNGDWTNYAADYSRRTQPANPPRGPIPGRLI